MIVVGSGAAGIYCALNIPSDKKVLLITKESLGKGNSTLAQGGITTVLGPEDLEIFIEDTLKAGGYANEFEKVRLMGEASFTLKEELINLGVSFTQKEGKVCYTQEGCHSKPRIIFSGDQTGKALMEVLVKQVLERKNIEIWEWACVKNILEGQNGKNPCCIGVIVERQGELKKVFSSVTVLATGGIGGLFKHTTNDATIKGEGLAIAASHGVKMKDLGKVQYHPTVARFSCEDSNRPLLLSEALRGEGAYLINAKGERFIDELLPRDQLTAGIKKEKGPVFLSLDHLESAYVKQRFPYIYETCLAQGYDLTKDPVPLEPAQHYHMGGIEIDGAGKTSMAGLYAVGEVSCSSVHGNNRLASNSLLEALVFGKLAGISIGKNQIKENIQAWQATQEGVEMSSGKLDYLKSWKKDYKKLKDLLQKEGVCGRNLL